MATAAIEGHSCVTPNCGEKAKLRCPNCVKLGKELHLIVYYFIKSIFKVFKMVRIFVHRIVLKAIGLNIKNYMYKPVCTCFSSFELKDHLFCFVESSSSTTESGQNYNPWPGYHFTGKLRPYPIVS